MTVSTERRLEPAAEFGSGAATCRRPPVSVVICAYSVGRLPVLKDCVAAVREQLQERDELVVVVDNNAELLEAARRVLSDGSKPLRLVQSRNHRGLSGARNAGIAAAGGELIVFLDDDAVPRPGWLTGIVEPFTDPEVIGAGGVAAPAWAARPPDWLPEEFLWVVGCSYRGLPDLPVEIRNPIGANMAFRHSVISTAGGFTEGIGRVGRLPLGCEETEFSIRAARTTGGRIVQQPAATVDHLVTIERMSVSYFLRRCWAEGTSKAFVSRLAGGDAALASERRYVTRTLPVAVLTGFRDGMSGDRSGFKRSLAVLAGLAVTVAGYLRGSLAIRAAGAGQPGR